MDKKRDRLRGPRRNRGNRLGIDRDVIDEALDPHICNGARSVVSHRRTIACDRILAKHPGHQFQVRDRQVVGAAAHWNDGRRRARAQVLEGLPQPRRPVLPVPGLHVGHKVNFLLRSIHRLDQRFQGERNSVEIEGFRSCLLGPKQLVEAVGLEGHVPRDHPVFGAEKHQADGISRMEPLRNHADLLDASLESRGGAVAMVHAVRSVEGDDHTRATLADLRGHGLPFLGERLREGESQQHDRETTKTQQDNVTQANLPRADPHAPVQELHRRPVSTFHFVATEQVGQDRQPDPERGEQEQRIEKTHGRAVDGPGCVDWRRWKNSLSSTSSG